MEQCIEARVVEHASVAHDPNYVDMKMFKATPKTYAAQDRARAEEAEETTPGPTKLAREVDQMAFDPMEMDFGVSPMPPPPPARARVQFTSGLDR